MKRVFKCWLLLVWGLAGNIQAGDLHLENGDVISGELQGIDADNLIWLSEQLGELQIKRSSVVSMETTTEMEIENAGRCLFRSGVFECQNATLSLAEVATAAKWEPKVPDAVHHEGSLLLAGLQQEGNKERIEWNVLVRNKTRIRDFRHSVWLQYESDAEGPEAVDEKYELGYGPDWFFAEHWFWSNQIYILKDEKKSILERHYLGTGIGYQVWDTESSALSVTVGATWIRDRFDVVDIFNSLGGVRPLAAIETEDERTSARWNLDYSATLYEDISLYHRHEYRKSLAATKGWEVDTETGLKIPMGAGLYTEFLLEWDYNNLPPEGNRREDRKFTVGIGYQW